MPEGSAILMLDGHLSSDITANIATLRGRFAAARPFRHLGLPAFFTADFVQALLDEFPPLPAPSELVNPLGMPSRKHEFNAITELGPAYRQLDVLLKAPEFLQTLSGITGIDNLIFDSEYHGAGTHNNLHGQGMLNHIDFNYHRNTGLHRRLNLLIYLNPEWEESWGGSLELHKDPWSPEQDEHISYAPALNSAVLFETSEHSWHGFPVINLPQDKRHLSRKSISVYYYTETRPAEEIAPRHSSIFVPRPLPEYVGTDQPLSATEYAALQDLFRRNARHIKSLYEWQKKHLETIAEQKRVIARLRAQLNGADSETATAAQKATTEPETR